MVWVSDGTRCGLGLHALPGATGVADLFAKGYANPGKTAKKKAINAQAAARRHSGRSSPTAPAISRTPVKYTIARGRSAAASGPHEYLMHVLAPLLKTPDVIRRPD
jgi:hypothetical protein